MFDIAWSELLLIAVVALVVIGPKDLPKAIYTFGKWVRKARVVAREFQTHIDDMMRETELDELRKEALKTRDLNIKKMMEDTIDPKGEVSKAFDVGLTGHPGSPVETAAATDSVPAEAPAPATTPEPAIAPPLPAPTADSAPPVPAKPDPVPAVSHPTDKQA
ncbi:Sec-independent protein translocase protein TatB [Azospirillum doebereinerae]|uniref:Sec-independent protein translocase protein TatB n=1 Tax=Azospirillum doebereinerae TaxID=92933 RepID=UPI001EE5F84D|nr:Sec-independent protein translocase protein TatB [Azospirillum doebereinerae]MCG5243615.1 Sec-independent protein translocase protein TatB [Azospirillum doebereinerae]